MARAEMETDNLSELWSALGKKQEEEEFDKGWKKLRKALSDFLMAQPLPREELRPLGEAEQERKKRLVRCFFNSATVLPRKPDDFANRRFNWGDILAAYLKYADEWTERWALLSINLKSDEFPEYADLNIRLGDKSESGERLLASFFLLKLFFSRCKNGAIPEAMARKQEGDRYKRFLFEEAELNVLVRKRHSLRKQQYQRLWELVKAALEHTNYTQYRMLVPSRWKTREDLITVFFADLFLRETRTLPADIDRNFLSRAYSNFLQDEVRQLLGIKGFEDYGPRPVPHSFAPDGDDAVLAQYGRTKEEVRQSAIAFLQSEAPWEFLEDKHWWIHCMLAKHHCPDKEERKPLVQVAQECRIPNYFVRARRLGITGGYKDAMEYAKTYLGQWIRSVLGPIGPEDREAVRIARKILCTSALKYRRDNGDQGAGH